jgi:hypothetical protein
MNLTGDILCKTCQTTNGFSSADRRSIIVLVVLTSISLALCYAGVLWFAIRTRVISNINTNIIVQNNEAFHDEGEQFEEFVQPIDNTGRTTTTQHVRIAVENESKL